MSQFGVNNVWSLEIKEMLTENGLAMNEASAVPAEFPQSV